MKRSNKVKILAGAATVAVFSAPLISMASCGSKSSEDITIDEKQKTKELESGKREATYEFKLGSKLETGETIEAELSNVESSQDGYTADIRNVVYEVGSSTVKVVTGITTKQNEILKEGATFTFAINLVKKDSSGKKTWSSTIKGFKMTYAAPTKQGLTIAEAAKVSYTNPAEMVHSYVFEVGSTITVDEECTFECDITKQSSETSGLTVKFSNAKPIYDNKQLSATFELEYEGSEPETDNSVTFDFTLSCVKNGEELWRQSFSDFKLKYLKHQMWIFPEYQWDSTYAGENEFHIYVIKNKDLHWGGEYNVGIQFDEATQELQIDSSIGVKEPTTEQGTSYFDIPVKLKNYPIPADTDVKFKPTLKYTQPGQEEQQLSFEEQTVTFYKTKIKSLLSDQAKVLETEQKSHTFNFSMADGETLPASAGVEDLTVIDASQDTTIAIDSVEIDSNQIKVKTNINTDLLDAYGEFKFVLKGTKDGKTWCQKIGYKNDDHLKINYVDPVTVPVMEVKTALDKKTASFSYRVTTGTDIAVNITERTVEKTGKSDDVSDFTPTPSENNTINVTIGDPVQSAQYNYNTWVSFDTKFEYNVTKGTLVKSGTKTISGFKVSYNGSVVYNNDLTQWTNAGEKTKIFTFKNLSGLTNIRASVQRTWGADGYDITAGAPIVTKDEIQLPITIVNNKTEYMDAGKWVYFKVTFSASDGSWSKTLPEDTTKDFVIKYKAGFTCAEQKNLETNASRLTSSMTITAPSAIKTGESYSLSISSQSSTRGVKVALGSHTASGTSIKQNLTLSKSSGELWTDGDTANFDLIIKKMNASGKVLCCERLEGSIVKYVEAKVEWNTSDWYVYETDPARSDRTALKKVRFTLSQPLGEGEELTWSHGVRKSGDAAPWAPDSEGNKVNTNGKDAWINIYFQYASGFYAGYHCVYDLTFTCRKEGKVVWEKTITNWYLYFLAGVKEPAQKEIRMALANPVLTFDLTGIVDTDKSSATVKFKTVIEKTDIKPGLNSYVEPVNTYADLVDKKALKVEIRVTGDTLSKDDWIKFKVKFTIEYTSTSYTAQVDTAWIEGFELIKIS